MSNDGTYDELLASVDPGNPELRVLRGLLAPGSDRARHRLYLSTSLNHYVEFPRDQTVHVRHLDSGESAIWLEYGADVTEVRVAKGASSLASGRIQRRFLAMARAVDDDNDKTGNCCVTIEQEEPMTTIKTTSWSCF